MTDSVPDARLVCVYENGVLVAGKAPAPEFSLSADFLLAMWPKERK